MIAAEPGPGQVITFYSYKGGTGRTMAMANVAWILASNAQRVLMIDWDLEAPGLHRFLGPALIDADQASTPGLIDFLVDYQLEATRAGDADVADDHWYEPYTNLMRFAQPVSTGFPRGRLDMIGAGRQNAEYAARVNLFDWRAFYERFKGKAFLDAVFAKLRLKYDYILIDSRTGVSDTSGICTVHLPDKLVVLFTMNKQSIDGASAVALDALGQRAGKLEVYPLPTRTENAELERLLAARTAARARFAPILAKLDTRGTDYLEAMAVPHVAYYLYEEQLAAVVEAGRTHVLLGIYEKLAGYVSGGSVTELKALPADQLEAARALFKSGHSAVATAAVTTGTKRHDVFLSYRIGDRDLAIALRDELSNLLNVFMDVDVAPGQDWTQAIESAIRGSSAVVALIGRSASPWVEADYTRALELGIPVIPVVVNHADIPGPLTRIQAIIAPEADPAKIAERVRAAVLEQDTSGRNASERIAYLYTERNQSVERVQRYRRIVVYGGAIAVLLLMISIAYIVVSRRVAELDGDARVRVATTAIAERAATSIKACENAQQGLNASLARLVRSPDTWPGACQPQLQEASGILTTSDDAARARIIDLDDKLFSDCTTRKLADACALDAACGAWLDRLAEQSHGSATP